MAAFSRLRTAGAWLLGTVVSPSEFEAFDDIRLAVLNGVAGSTHAPSAPIIVNGSGIQTNKTAAVGTDVANKDYVDAGLGSAALARVARYYFSASATVSGSTMPITAGAVFPASGAWTLASNQVQVPSAGVYRVDFRARAKLNTGASPYGSANILCMLTGSPDFEQGRATGERWTGTTTDYLSLNGHALVNITDPATQKLYFKNGNSSVTIEPKATGADEDAAMAHVILIERLGNAS